MDSTGVLGAMREEDAKEHYDRIHRTECPVPTKLLRGRVRNTKRVRGGDLALVLGQPEGKGGPAF